MCTHERLCHAALRRAHGRRHEPHAGHPRVWCAGRACRPPADAGRPPAADVPYDGPGPGFQQRAGKCLGCPPALAWVHWMLAFLSKGLCCRGRGVLVWSRVTARWAGCSSAAFGGAPQPNLRACGDCTFADDLLQSLNGCASPWLHRRFRLTAPCTRSPARPR